MKPINRKEIVEKIVYKKIEKIKKNWANAEVKEQITLDGLYGLVGTEN